MAPHETPAAERLYQLAEDVALGVAISPSELRQIAQAVQELAVQVGTANVYRAEGLMA